MKLCELLRVLHTNTDITVYSAERIGGKCGYTLLKPMYKGKARDCAIQDCFIDHVFSRGYNEIECYARVYK